MTAAERQRRRRARLQEPSLEATAWGAKSHSGYLAPNPDPFTDLKALWRFAQSLKEISSAVHDAARVALLDALPDMPDEAAEALCGELGITGHQLDLQLKVASVIRAVHARPSQAKLREIGASLCTTPAVARLLTAPLP